MERELLPEAEEFGNSEAWCLINRRVVDGHRTMVRALPVRGRGVLLQTSRQSPDGVMTADTPFMIDRALIMETMVRTESELQDEQGQPLKIQHQCNAREIIDVENVRRMYGLHKRKPGDKKPPMPGAPDPSHVIAGAVLTLEQRRLPVAPVEDVTPPAE